jgi:transposase-like protein
MDLQRRTILVLHDLLEVSISDIARELGVNRNTVQNRLRLAREDFRATVTRLGPEKRRALRAPGVAPPPGAGAPARVAPGKAKAKGRGLPRGPKAKS